MIAIFLIALAAGSASALMFASIVSGALISLLLFYLAPLPLMVAALGWGPLSAASGGIAASIGLGAIFGVPLCIAFAVAVALPAWWLGHLVLLGRPVSAAASSPNLEWYPVGRIMLWTSGFAALITIAALLSLGLDAATIRSTLRQGLLGIIQIVRAHDAASTGESERVVDILVSMAPVAAAIVTTTTLTLNLWLAARIIAISGRLHRPWPALRTVALPSMSSVAFCIVLAFCFAGGLLGIAAQVVAASLMLAYALTGFAVLHTLTAALKTRAVWLSCTYCLVLVFVWPVVVMAAVGLADAVFGIRQRFLNSRPPPIPAS
ncbi:MAG TPA: DUF2232 domain-containing protein [Bradyrhizobium sp.]|uniref:DUF2232 domain-containing protein n=1 Tax=Bradyrhizobium sp. TaxID=376 RepID=UPI002B4868B5|nr:DUF2232 domain-containing protein [Bradyrhizobium sp.]HKO72331.1 DUF2232 domain-containing protein [Bradyrhizobium sp.]